MEFDKRLGFVFCFGRKSMTKSEQRKVAKTYHWSGQITSQWHLLNV